MSTRPTNLKPGIILTLITAIAVITASCIIGRNDFFLLLNGNLGNGANIFFKYWTNLGDGVMWILVAVIFFLYRRKYFPLLVAAVLISTLLTQVTKNYIIVAEPRPTAAIADLSQIHTVYGVELHTAYSFPSGHTATAFTIFLLVCFFTRSRSTLLFGFICAALVGYSRVYLAQHFPLDVGGGMIVAVITIWLSILIQNRFNNAAPSV